MVRLALAWGNMLLERFANDPYHVLFHPEMDKSYTLKKHSDILKEKFVNLTRDLDAMHKEVTLAKKAQSLKREKAFRRKHGLPEEDDDGHLIMDCDYRIGDYVLVAVANTKPLRKLEALWRGPYKVVELVHTELNSRGDYNNREFVVEHLVTHERQTTHAMRAKFFSDKFLDECIDMEALQHHITAQENGMFEIEQIFDYSFDNETMQWAVHCLWKESNSDVSHAEDETYDPDTASWDPLSVMIADQPQLIRALYDGLGMSDR